MACNSIMANCFHTGCTVPKLQENEFVTQDHWGFNNLKRYTDIFPSLSSSNLYKVIRRLLCCPTPRLSVVLDDRKVYNEQDESG